MNVSELRDALTPEQLRALGLPTTIMSDYEFAGALLRDRREAPDDHLVAFYDRRGLLNVIAWLVANR